MVLQIILSSEISDNN